MEQMINRAYLLIGGNMGNRLALLEQASSMLAQHCGSIVRQSAVYETAAWGRTNQPAFLNQAIELNTSLEAPALLTQTNAIELALGRVRNEQYAPRLMDIDLIFFNEAIIHLPQLTIPHPHIAVRRFVLVPLAELIPDYIHPVLKISVQTMLEQCSDPLDVHKL